jgi:hypothetical protein
MRRPLEPSPASRCSPCCRPAETPNPPRPTAGASFDGHSTSGWRAFGKADFPAKGWVVEDGWLKHQAKGGGGDIITAEQFVDFDLTWEWRVAPGANSGVKYFIDEGRGAPIGHEYQLIDDKLHPDALIGPKRQTASLYDALPPTSHPLKPAGEINASRILVRGNRRRALAERREGARLRARLPRAGRARRRRASSRTRRSGARNSRRRSCCRITATRSGSATSACIR